MTRPSMAAFLAAHDVEAKPGRGGWQAVQCPFHDDTTASASFSEAEGVFKCHACDVKGSVEQIAKQVGASPEEVASLPASTVAAAPVKAAPVLRDSPAQRALREAAASYHASLLGLAGQTNVAKEYVQSRGFDFDATVDAMLGWVKDPAPGHEAYTGRLAIPYITATGVVDIRFRCLKGHDCKAAKCPKYLSLPGHKARMYEARQVIGAGSVIAVCEGELDTLTMIHQVGIPAVGLPGATNWAPHYPLILSGFDAVLVMGDGDDAGRKFANTVASALDNGIAVPMPDGHDVNSLVLSDGAATLRELVDTFSGQS